MIDQRGIKLTIIEATKDMFKGVFDYKGYTTVEGYWKPMIIILPMVVIFWLWALANLVNSIFTGGAEGFFLNLFVIHGVLLLGIVITLPSYVRRLRDVGFNVKGILLVIVGNGILNWLFTQIGLGFFNNIFALIILIVVCLPSNYFMNQPWSKQYLMEFLRKD